MVLVGEFLEPGLEIAELDQLLSFRKYPGTAGPWYPRGPEIEN